jgi:hypothetical protein
VEGIAGGVPVWGPCGEGDGRWRRSGAALVGIQEEGNRKTMGRFGLYPKIALPKFWLANILVELFLAHKLANIG